MRTIAVFFVVSVILSSAAWGDLGQPAVAETEASLVEQRVTPATTGEYSPDVPRPPQMQEGRFFDPACAQIGEAPVEMLADRLFALAWLNDCRPVWGPFPWPSIATTTYGKKPEGVSLFRIDESWGQWRPGWTWWKDDCSGIHLERGVRGNWIMSTFVVQESPRLLQSTVTKIREVIKTIEVPEIREVIRHIPVYYPVLPERSFAPLATPMDFSSPSRRVNHGSSQFIQGLQVKLSLFELAVRRLRAKPSPEGPDCGPPPDDWGWQPVPGDAAGPADPPVVEPPGCDHTPVEIPGRQPGDSSGDYVRTPNRSDGSPDGDPVEPVNPGS